MIHEKNAYVNDLPVVSYAIIRSSCYYYYCKSTLEELCPLSSLSSFQAERQTESLPFPRDPRGIQSRACRMNKVVGFESGTDNRRIPAIRNLSLEAGFFLEILRASPPPLPPHRHLHRRREQTEREKQACRVPPSVASVKLPLFPRARARNPETGK